MSAGFLVGAAPALADTTIAVNTTLSSSPSGDGLCSLAEAIDWSQGGADPDCSTAAPNGTTTIDLAAGKYVVPRTLFLNHTLDIVGAGAGKTDIDGAGSYQVMYAYPTANVQISGVEISGGNSGIAACGGPCISPEPGNDGGGIYNDGTLVLHDDLVTGNTTGGGTAGLLLCIFGPCAGNSGDAGGNGGGIYNAGALTLDGSTVSANTTGTGAAGGPGEPGASSPGAPGGNGGAGGSGAGIYNAGGTLTVTDSTFSGNATGAGGNGGGGSPATVSGGNGGNAGAGGDAGSGGAIYSSAGSVTITGSTLAGNSTGPGSAPGTPGAGNGSGTFGAIAAAGHAGVGGAILYTATGGQTATLSNDTLTGNSTGAAAPSTNPSNGGIAGAIGFRGVGSLTNVTIAGNTAAYGAGAIYVIPGSTLTEQNSIIASNTASVFGNCAGSAVTDGGHNIIFGEASCPGTVSDPKLRALADNGGPTQTMRPGAGSPAVDAVPAGACTVTTDQRGVARPQGGGCDTGAYEVAPPNLASLGAAATGTGTALVTGRVTANLSDTNVVVRYGTSTAYTAATAAVDIGSGLAAASLSVPLSGLQPSTTYHLDVLATNADGTSTSSDMTVTTPAAVVPAGKLSLTVPSGKITGDAVSVKLSCASGGGACAGALTLSSRVTTLRGKVIAVSAAASRKAKGSKRKTVTRIVGRGRYALQSGQTQILKLSLNGAGRRLLRARHRLPTLLTSSGTARITRHVTFVFRPRRHKKR